MRGLMCRMSGSRSCPDCGTGILEEETEVTDVCRNCGYTVENVSLRQQSAYEGYSGSSEVSLEHKYKTRIEDNRIAKLQKSVLENMQSYLGQYQNHDELYERASQMFLSSVKTIMRARYQHKTALGVACMTVVLREAGIPVLLPTICRDNSVDSRKIMKAMNEVKQVMQHDNAIVPIEGVVDAVLQSNPSLMERQGLRDRTTEICHLLMALNFSGSREVAVTIALYFALISEDPVKVPAMSYSAFCKHHSIRKGEGMVNQYSAMESKIILLAKRLPWSPTNVKRNNYHIFLKDILKLKQVLIKEDWSDIKKVPDRKRKSDFASDGSVITDQMKLEMPAANLNALRKAPRLSDETPGPLFVSTSETIGDSEVDEDWLDEYIRSPEEVEALKKLRKKLEARK